MKIELKETPREFNPTGSITLKDYGTVFMEADEQLTFETESGSRHDLTRKEWGWYLSNSVNSSLKRQGYKTAVVMGEMSGESKVVINVVEEDKVVIFLEYLKENNSQVVCWLDEWFS